MGRGSNDEQEQTLNQLLACMDGLDSTNGVCVLAATNRKSVSLYLVDLLWRLTSITSLIFHFSHMLCVSSENISTLGA